MATSAGRGTGEGSVYRDAANRVRYRPTGLRDGCERVTAETTGRYANVTDVAALATFDFAAFFAAKDGARRDRDMGWYELWYQSAQLNAERDVHPVCGGAVSRLGKRGETSCQYALYLLRWLGQAAEEFLEAKETGFEDHRS
jgi:hypothetical protein